MTQSRLLYDHIGPYFRDHTHAPILNLGTCNGSATGSQAMHDNPLWHGAKAACNSMINIFQEYMCGQSTANLAE